MLSELPKERPLRGPSEERAAGDDDHARLAPREHDIHAVQRLEEPRRGRAHDRDDHQRGLVPCCGFGFGFGFHP